MTAQRLKLIIDEVDRHLELLNYEEEKLKSEPLNENSLRDYDKLILLDAFIFRFIKVQSTIGEKLFPHFYEFLTEKPYTEVAFIDTLKTL